jgi:hypothetical protein
MRVLTLLGIDLPQMRLHVWHAVFGLPPMLVALALDWPLVFAVASALRAVALRVFLTAIRPMLHGLSGPTLAVFIPAAVMLVTGGVLALAFAIDPGAAARLCQVHAEISLFGWAGLLGSGVCSYLFPRFAGWPLRWPRLAWLQVVVLRNGVVLAAAGGICRGEGGPR